MKLLTDYYPADLAAWMQAGPMGAVPAVPMVSFQPKLPFDWFKSEKDGITLGRKIYIRRAEPIGLTDFGGMELLFHELIHVRQFHKIGFFWWMNYIFNSSELEKEAYRESRQWLLKYTQDFPQYMANRRILIGEEAPLRCGLQKS